MKKHGEPTVKEMSDSGQALALILLVLGLIFPARGWFWAAAAVLVLNMASPSLFRWWACLWLSLSHGLGVVMSHVVLGAVFYLVLMPMGLIRKALGRDAMAFGKWRRGTGSVFAERNHTFIADDLRNPY